MGNRMGEDHHHRTMPITCMDPHTPVCMHAHIPHRQSTKTATMVVTQ